MTHKRTEQALPIPAERMARAVGSAPYDLGGFVVARERQWLVWVDFFWASSTPVERMEGVLAYYAPMTLQEQRAGIEFRSERRQ